MTRAAFNHVRRGAGEPLVLIHGIGHHLQGWDPVARLLEDSFDVIAVDSPGFGRSSPIDGHAIEDFTDAFAAWFEQLGLERPHVAGNSMGGGIGLELARRGAARSVCAISPVGFWSEGERRFAQVSLQALAGMPDPLKPALLRLGGTTAGRTALAAQLFARPWRMPAAEFQSVLRDAWDADVMLDVLAAFQAYEFADGEQLDGVPVTIAWGDKDRLLLFKPQSARARAALPRARHVTLHGLGHVPFFDDPGMVASTIRSAARATL